MKTCKYCGVGVQSLKDCNCGGVEKALAVRYEKRKVRQKRYYWKHTFVRLCKGITKNARNKNRSDAHTILALDLWGLAKRQRLLCPVSGRKLSNRNISIDHIVPLSKGGTHDISNLRLTIKEINYARINMSDADFIALCREVAAHNPEKID